MAYMVLTNHRCREGRLNSCQCGHPLPPSTYLPKRWLHCNHYKYTNRNSSVYPLIQYIYEMCDEIFAGDRFNNARESQGDPLRLNAAVVNHFFNSSAV